jgi:hypothetical protein
MLNKNIDKFELESVFDRIRVNVVTTEGPLIDDCQETQIFI